MEKLYIAEIASSMKGRIAYCSENITFDSFCTKIGMVKKGCLFFAFMDTDYEYKELLRLAFEKGAEAVVIPKGHEAFGPEILVDDLKTAYADACAFYRCKFDIPVVAITGSCGKTSTKDMVISIIKDKYKNICKTPASYNTISEIIPRILSLNKVSEACVFEMGFGGILGQIRKMSAIAQPTITIITNIGTSHLKNLSAKEDVFKAKMEITTFMNKNGVLIINSDDEYLSSIKDKPFRIIRTSILGRGDYNGENIVDMMEEGVEFDCILRGSSHRFRLKVPGIHNVYNALAAIAAGDILGIEPDNIKKGLLSFKTQGLTMNIIHHKKNIMVINDCFNANLASMKAAIDVLHSFRGGRKIAVLGDMLELGTFSEEVHREVGRYLKGKVDVLVAVGEDARYIYEESKDSIESFYFVTKEIACSYLKDSIREKDCILIKASRHMDMQTIAHYLREEFN